MTIMRPLKASKEVFNEIWKADKETTMEAFRQQFAPLIVEADEEVPAPVDFTALADFFDPNILQWRIQQRKGNRCFAVPYIDARTIDARLDRIVGPDRWKVEYTPLDKSFFTYAENKKKPKTEGGFICTISILSEGIWIAKSDIAEITDFEPLKGGASNSYRRCASRWGIGRYLYSLKGQWTNCHMDNGVWVISVIPTLPAWALPKQRIQDDPNPNPEPEVIPSEEDGTEAETPLPADPEQQSQQGNQQGNQQNNQQGQQHDPTQGGAPQGSQGQGQIQPENDTPTTAKLAEWDQFVAQMKTEKGIEEVNNIANQHGLSENNKPNWKVSQMHNCAKAIRALPNQQQGQQQEEPPPPPPPAQ